MAKETQMKVDPVFCSIHPALFDPKIILESSEFKVLTDPEEIAQCSESDQNIACCYNDKKQVCRPLSPCLNLISSSSSHVIIILCTIARFTWSRNRCPKLIPDKFCCTFVPLEYAEAMSTFGSIPE
jgi:hypothetical protein